MEERKELSDQKENKRKINPITSILLQPYFLKPRPRLSS